MSDDKEIAKGVALAVVIAVVVLVMSHFARPRELNVVIERLVWERTINVEKYKTVQENAWYLPSGGRLLYAQEELHHMNTATLFLGGKMGFAATPAYRTRYYYEIERWAFERAITTGGVNDTPFWGTEELDADEQWSVADEFYRMVVTRIDNGESFAVLVEYSVWSSYGVGQEVSMKIPLLAMEKD
jgi:hypothetical protein